MALLRRMSRSRLGVLAGLVVLAGGAGYIYYTNIYAPSQEASEPSLQTSLVRQGDLVILASGSGTIISASEVSLGFGTSGTLSELPVNVGDVVQAGDVLARLDDMTARQGLTSAQIQHINAQLDLADAQSQLNDLRDGSTETELAAAEAALAIAREAYQRLVDGPDSSEIEEAELDLARARNSLWSAQSSRDATCGQNPPGSTQCNQAQSSVANAEISVRLAEMALQRLMEPATDAEIRVAAAEVAQAEALLQELLGGPSEEDIASAEALLERAGLSLSLAELNLRLAQQDLEGTTLLAPMDGIVMAVSAGVGEAVSGSLLTLADLTRTYLEIFLDETDLDRIALGYPVEVTFDALPDNLFTGRVVQVDPSLVSSGGVSAIRAVVQLDEPSSANPAFLPVGLNAAVDVIVSQAEGALLVPIEALRELGPDEYAVFVMEDDRPVLRTVEVGLMDFTFAEILSGLEVGEIVSTGIVETG